jgi:flagellar biosynthesis regulator FlbT
MTKQEFIDQKIKEVEKMMYVEPDWMLDSEREDFRKFFNKFIEDFEEVEIEIKNHKLL